MQQLAPSPSQRGMPQYGLVSLWNMLRFHAANFVVALEELNTMRGLLVQGGGIGPIHTDNDMREHAAKLASAADQLAMPFTLTSVRRLQSMLENEKVSIPLLINSIEETHRRLQDELESVMLMHVDRARASYIEPQEPLFGPTVAMKFPNASFDIEEAGKCYGLGRGTACVFHLMRAIEIGLHYLSTAVGATLKPKWGWQAILNDGLEPAINAMPESTDDEKQKKRALQQARAHLHAVRLSWRNDTMHPKVTYTDEEAADVFAHTKAFMKHLAERV